MRITSAMLAVMMAVLSAVPTVKAEENVQAAVAVDVAGIAEDGFWAHMSRNWLKYVAGALTLVAGYKVAENNGWLGLGDDDEPSGRTAQSGDGNSAVTTAQDSHNGGIDANMATDIQGDGNSVVYDITVITAPME